MSGGQEVLLLHRMRSGATGRTEAMQHIIMQVAEVDIRCIHTTARHLTIMVTVHLHLTTYTAV